MAKGKAAGHRSCTPPSTAIAEDVRLLLAQGANPNAQNDDGGTALMYAIEDAEKTRLLLDRGANPNLRSGEGRTALLIAVGRTGSYAVVKLLLENGAMRPCGFRMDAAPCRWPSRLVTPPCCNCLLDHGAGRKPLPLGQCAAGWLPACFDLLLKLAEPADLSGALNAAVR